MAKKEDRKKQKKRKKEAVKSRKRAERDPYPRTEILLDGADKDFMLAVEKVIQTFDYANEEHCPESVRAVHRLLRGMGLEILEQSLATTAFDDYAEQHAVDPDEFRQLEMWALHFHLGDWIFRNLPDRFTKSPLPFYFFQVIAKDRGFVVSFAFLPRMDLPAQRVWHSPFDPTVEIRGEEYKVVFTKHVLERACERMSLTQPIQYFGVRGIYEHFRNCVYFEHVVLENGQDAVRLLGPCQYELGDMYKHEVAQLRKADLDAGPWFFVVGYCPVEVTSSGFAVGLTMLFPGYNNTPEAGLVERTRMNPMLLAELRKSAQDNSLGAVFMNKNLKPLRWYHHNGVPQVVRLQRPLYRAQ